MVPSGINVPPGNFGKNNNSTPWNKRTSWKTMENSGEFNLKIITKPFDIRVGGSIYQDPKFSGQGEN